MGPSFRFMRLGFGFVWTCSCVLDRLIIQIVNLKDQKVVLLITMEVKMI